MEGSSSNISYRQSWNNLVDLPSNLASLLYNANVSPQEVIIELVSQAKNKCYAGWSGMNSKGARVVGIDPIFAHSLRLADKQLVTVNVKIRNFKSSKIFLEPEQFSDWELVELHANHIEAKLIEQSRCVALNQVLVVYPTKTSSIRLQVKDIGSSTETYALIDPFAEVGIAPKIRERKKTSQSVKSSKSSKSTYDDVSQGPILLKRGISLPNSLFTDKNENICYEITVNTGEFSRVFKHSHIVSVSVIPGPDSKHNRAPIDQLSADSKRTENASTQVLVESKSISARLLQSDTAPYNTVGLSSALAVALNVENKVGYKVLIRQAHKSLTRRLGTLIIHPYVTQSKKNENLSLNSSVLKEQKSVLSRAIHEHLFQKKQLNQSPISNFCKIPIIPDVLPNGALMTIKRNDDPHAWAKAFSLEEDKNPVKIEIGDNLLRSVSFVQDPELVSEQEPIYGMQAKLDGVSEFISTFRNSGVMVHGSSGSGKTSFLKCIAKEMREHGGMFTKYVACETKMNENFDQLCSNLNEWVNEALWHEPSLLVLDNLDKILSAEAENTDSTVSNQLTECLMSLLGKIGLQKNTNVCLVVSGLSKESFNKQLSSSHLIQNYVHLSAPNKATRTTILDEYLLKDLGCDLKFDIMDIVSETEGYLPNDLKVLSDRILYESLHSLGSMNHISEDKHPIQKFCFEKALSGYQPSNLRGVKLEKSGTSWADIGGLSEAKRVLLETLEWPTKYAPIFSNCPLRLRSGILLYGYPGCGKTLLASAIAGQCGLNFISIKGPEILNKYIGASEQSVRELFDRAQSAKPCILFFDEFDSIAPKRGHDSTGVTDRVVNQMLTQMDGAEGLDGVYVLAATSRPDLIDSALLRPGRLDKSIICEMPNFDDRLEILKCICEKMDLADDVDLELIASKTEGFSGADMQGLGYNAYLKAVHEKLNQEQEAASVDEKSKESPTYDFFQINAEALKSNKLRLAEKLALLQKIEKIFENKGNKPESKQHSDNNNSKVLIRQTHIKESLADTKPSITATERRKLDGVYSEFLTGRDGNMPDGSASNDVGGRTTLM